MPRVRGGGDTDGGALTRAGEHGIRARREKKRGGTGF